jgi:hypothetical protein
MKPKLVTVTGYRTNTLEQMLNHYKNDVSEIHLVNYYSTDMDNKNAFNHIREIAEKYGCVYHERKEKVFNWEAVTKFYNEIKSLYPNDWWIVSDDDELQLYWDDISSIIEECEHNGWEFVTGGFVDKIGENGEFPIVNSDTDLWKAFPMSSFFRYPLSGACPNKVTLMRGRIEVTSGQHYAIIDGQTTWRWQGWNHPLRYPINKGFAQVHHFKWDSSCVDRIKAVSDIKQSYAYSEEYSKMYSEISKNNFKINLKDFSEWTWKCDNNFVSFGNWNKLTKQIVSI